MDESEDIHTFAGRLATFERPHHMNKRRASQTSKKKAQSSMTWPHTNPNPDQLARAGFYYRPSSSSQDSVTCFLCDKALDGWDTDDNPALEHLSHVPHCGWAINICIEQRSQDMDRAEEDPLSDKMMQARRDTFRDVWPHQSKKGWKCKLEKMVEAGWCYNPLPEADDCVQCFYCGVSLDGWEPKDDPWEEHQRRAPECHFFTLIQESTTQKGQKSRSTKGKPKAKASRTSKVSRASTQSIVSINSDGPSLALDHSQDLTNDDDTMLTATSTISKAGTKGRKNAANSKKPRAGRKKNSTLEEPVMPDAEISIVEQVKTRSTRNQKEPVTEESFVQEADATQLGAKKPRAARGKKPSTMKAEIASESAVDEAMILDETSASPAAPIKQPKTRAKKQTIVKTDQPSEAETQMAESESVAPEPPVRKASRVKPSKKKDQTISDEPIVDEPVKSKRGKKRTNDGLEKLESSIVLDSTGIPEPEVVETKPAPAKAPAKRGRTTSRATKKVVEPEPKPQSSDAQTQVPAELQATPVEAKPPKKTASKRSKSRQESSSHIDTVTEPPERDEQQKQILVEHSTQPLSPQPEPASKYTANSPQSSDAENHPPSSRQSLNASGENKAAEPLRVPIKPSTPTSSPSKRNMIAGGLMSAKPWTTIDLETVFLLSPSLKDRSPRDKKHLDVEVVMQNLTSPEKKMSVEEWIMWNAERAEGKLKNECERLIGIFEGEGVKAIQALEGIECA